MLAVPRCNMQADPAVSSRSLLDEIADTEALVAANDDMIMAVFRGTSEFGPDWATNLKLVPSPEPNEWGLNRADTALHSVSFFDFRENLGAGF